MILTKSTKILERVLIFGGRMAGKSTKSMTELSRPCWITQRRSENVNTYISVFNAEITKLEERFIKNRKIIS